ncbi:MarR family winged helix-turn-helix transcriptional regulator [Comamonas testosteroni]|jgi:DNA-binding MarR family transcriptional regulator|uniref:Transcriptional regulator, MarR family n=2 Tax=Comamonas testosteroni TaxID=285 RepID=B7WTE3_COMTK|nr:MULTISPECIES: MarR family winged helix-turn-helix transcriptional regulator [Comamonas]AIJ49014.1 MarR family transcriptional regulator [Comamonas testosteroni TK102]EED65511.1 transcriptional regulator, MarR family [Comamonas testosteroni KF-1]MPS91490.1 MarR family transcriptional regulator [Comamonas sp.]WQG68917.1 MarR family winged helix-turn-helix transcriptional regulator [Comamonas testosteroni]
MLAHKTAESDSKPVRPARSSRSREAEAAGSVPENESSGAVEVFAVDRVDASFLESLLGYNARRASLSLVGVFMRCMERFDLKIVEFSVLSLVGSNPGITSRQLCQQLAVLPPNMVGMIDVLGKRGFLERRPHPRDGRATGLYLTAAGGELVDTAEPELKSSEARSIAHLSATEQAQLMELLQKLYR